LFQSKSVVEVLLRIRELPFLPICLALFLNKLLVVLVEAKTLTVYFLFQSWAYIRLSCMVKALDSVLILSHEVGCIQTLMALALLQKWLLLWFGYTNLAFFLDRCGNAQKRVVVLSMQAGNVTI